MPPRRHIAAFVLASSALLAVPATPVLADEERAPELSATLEECETGLREDDRLAEFRGAMPRWSSSARRLWMRFDLERREDDGEDWERVEDAPTFGRWEKSRSGVKGFVYTKHVDGLSPGEYRAVVRFRWKSSSGRTIRSRTRRSKVCRVRDMRPDLRVTDVRVLATGFGPVLEVDVENDGRTETRRRTELALRAADREISLATVPEIEAGETATVLIPAAGCLADDAELVVDPEDAVEEADEDDNRRERPCG